MHVCNGFKTVDVGPWMGGHAVAAEKVRVHVRAPHMHVCMHAYACMHACMCAYMCACGAAEHGHQGVGDTSQTIHGFSPKNKKHEAKLINGIFL